MKCILLSINNFDEEYAYDTIKDIIKSDMKVLCIPFASDLNWLLKEGKKELARGGEFYNKHYKPFGSYGIPTDNFYVAKLSDDEYFIKQKIYEANIIYFSGGYMENILHILNHLNLLDYIEMYKENKIFIGESAGALILQDFYMEVPHIESHYKKYRKKRGLNITNKVNTIVHYDDKNKKHKFNFKILKLITRLDKRVVCLTDSGAIVIIDDEVKYLGNYYK